MNNKLLNRDVGAAEPGTAEVCVRTTEAGKRELDPAAHARKIRLQRQFLGWGTPALLVILWEIAARNEWIETQFFPGPSTIFDTAIDMIKAGTWQSDMLVSLRSLLIGVGLGYLIGAALGIIMASFKWIRWAFEPMLSALYTVPKLAILPLLLLVFGLGDAPALILVTLGVFFIVWISILGAVLELPDGYRESAEAFGVRGLQRLRHIILPALLPQLFITLRLVIGQGILLVISLEFLVGDKGIGYRIWHSWGLFLADQMYVGIVSVALLGFVLSSIVQYIGRLAAPWSAGASSRES